MITALADLFAIKVHHNTLIKLFSDYFTSILLHGSPDFDIIRNLKILEIALESIDRTGRFNT